MLDWFLQNMIVRDIWVNTGTSKVFVHPDSITSTLSCSREKGEEKRGARGARHGCIGCGI